MKSENNISEREMEIIRQQLAELTDKTNKIYDILVGQPEFKQEGIIQIVKKNESYIEKDKHLKAKIVGGAFIGGAIWSFLLKAKFWDWFN